MKKSPLSELWGKQGLNESSVAELMGVPEFLVTDWSSGAAVPNPHQVIAMSLLCCCDIRDIYLAILRTPLNNPDA